MAKKQRNRKDDIVKGKSVKELSEIGMETFLKMNKEELKHTVQRLASAANKRIRTFQKRNEKSPYITKTMEGKGFFSTKNKNLNQLRAEYIRARNFLTAESTTVKGWNNVKKKIVKGLKGKKINARENILDDLFSAYEKLKETDPSVSSRRLKYKILEELSRKMEKESYDMDEILAETINKINSYYEESIEAEYDKTTDTNKFFRIK